jgi:hypothetical protein
MCSCHAAMCIYRAGLWITLTSVGLAMVTLSLCQYSHVFIPVFLFMKISKNTLRMPSSGMLHSVAHVRIDVSKEPLAPIIRVTRISEIEMLAVTSNRRTLRKNAT